MIRVEKPFEIYYGTKSNVLRHANDDEVDFEPTIEDIKYKINDRYYEEHEEQIKKLRNHAKRYSEKKNHQLIKKYLPTKTSDVGENVLIRGTEKNGISNTKLRHVIKRKKSMYKVKFENPVTNLVAFKWISVEDITDLQQKHSGKGRLSRKMFLVRLSNERKLTRQGFDITFNPSPDGNCQFSTIVYHLQSIGIYRSAETLRQEVVSYLSNNPAFGGANFILDFLDMGWEDYYMKCKVMVHSVMH